MSKSVPSNISPEDLNEWLKKSSQEPLLIDVREDEELMIAPFPAKVVHLPLSKYSDWSKTLQQQLLHQTKVVVICHSGIRSWQFANWLVDQNWGYEIWNLEGGIEAWSVNIDPNVPRY